MFQVPFGLSLSKPFNPSSSSGRTVHTIRLDDTTKERIAAAADHAGKSAHAFILDAIAQTVEQLEQLEQDREFNDIADERWERIRASGKTVSWDDAKACLEAKSLGKSTHKPLVRSARH
jgi:predicted transcriptional regulator